jgi:hypothetical protein
VATVRSPLGQQLLHFISKQYNSLRPPRIGVCRANQRACQRRRDHRRVYASQLRGSRSGVAAQYDDLTFVLMRVQCSR